VISEFLVKILAVKIRNRNTANPKPKLLSIVKLPIAEFALHHQHETSCDSETQIKKDVKSKFRKQIGSLQTTSLNSKGKEEALESQC